MASYHAAVNGEATEKLIRYHEERAKGGVGMNIVEATYVARSGNSFDLGLGISDDFMIKGLSKLTAAVHRHDGKIAIQLQHGGRFGNPPTSGCPRLLVSMIPGLAPTENARVMDSGDIEGMVEAYVQAARRAVEAGFDAVEIHGPAAICSNSRVRVHQPPHRRVRRIARQAPALSHRGRPRRPRRGGRRFPHPLPPYLHGGRAHRERHRPRHHRGAVPRPHGRGRQRLRHHGGHAMLL